VSAGDEDAPGAEVISLAAHREAAADQVRVRLSGHADGPQRRDFFRVNALLCIRARVPGYPMGPIDTRTRNVSANGLLLEDAYGLPLGTALELELELEHDDVPLKAHGIVVRAVPPRLKGIIIDAISVADRERLVRYVAARQREDLKSKVRVR
jgi:c-di-GMP-binding flagellar brake protein YcgR